jgi:hypothetical protein
MYESMYTVPGTNAGGWPQVPVYSYMMTQSSPISRTLPNVLAIHIESPVMPKKTPPSAPVAPAAPELTSDAVPPKREDTSKVIQLKITPYFNGILRGYLYYSEMTNRSLFDLSITHIIDKLKSTPVNERLAVFSLYPKFKDGKTFSSYATKALMDELERYASDSGVPYQSAYYGAVLAYTKELISCGDENMTKALKDAQGKFPDLKDQIM